MFFSYCYRYPDCFVPKSCFIFNILLDRGIHFFKPCLHIWNAYMLFNLLVKFALNILFGNLSFSFPTLFPVCICISNPISLLNSYFRSLVGFINSFNSLCSHGLYCGFYIYTLYDFWTYSWLLFWSFIFCLVCLFSEPKFIRLLASGGRTLSQLFILVCFWTRMYVFGIMMLGVFHCANCW